MTGEPKGNRICRCLADVYVTGSNTEGNTLVPGFAAEGSQECSKAPKVFESNNVTGFSIHLTKFAFPECD